MKQEPENNTSGTQTGETYEAPRLEVVELETEGPLLTPSGSNSPWGGSNW